ncbi:anti-sigma factor [Sinorhizobium meliloti]|uniref:anti-sigma factor family protein n=1 Tax=Rhizobium meliloti TaxID=382 RepID=UPI0023808691|nr:anti-sigma factor [Sinorhizobium meliloti]MDE3771906.1 anti-sigma factor [Sinorhizobium meliloti]MDW9532682.1 anti-sigma factor [Sinorhizobium meliloti]
MLQTKGLALEVRLSAYIDGELAESEKSELDALLARDDEARALLEKLKSGSAFGNGAFENFLHDPVPLALVRQIKQGPGINPKSERVTTASLPRRSARIWPRILAASTALFLLGGAAGFILGSATDFAEPMNQADDRPWIDIVGSHRIFSRQKEHLVEVPGTQAAEIETWLAASVGVSFTVPNLDRKGLSFEGARLLAANGRPVAQLVYRDREAEVFTICFLKQGDGQQSDEFSETIRGDLGLVSWEREGVSFVMIGPSSDPALQDLAETVAANI